MRRVPGVYILSMEPRSWELDRGFFQFRRQSHRHCQRPPRLHLGGRGLPGVGLPAGQFLGDRADRNG